MVALSPNVITIISIYYVLTKPFDIHLVHKPWPIVSRMVCMEKQYYRAYCVLCVPYSRLFSLGANFPEFREWTHNVGKIYSGMLCKVRLWVIGGPWSDHNVEVIISYHGCYEWF